LRIRDSTLLQDVWTRERPNSGDAIAGVAATAAALLALVLLVLPAAPGLRLFAVGLALCLGPAGLALRVVTGRDLAECLTIGLPTNIGVVMLLAQLMVTTHQWHPIPALIGVLDVTIALGCALAAFRDRIGGSAS
jgi:hypothetical protein